MKKTSLTAGIMTLVMLCTTLAINLTSCTVNVKNLEVAVTDVKLSPARISIYAGMTKTLTATVSPSNATDKTVTWTSSDETVATVEDGVVTGIKAGTATITAKAGAKSASCMVTVSDPIPTVISVTGITLDSTTASIFTGKTKTLIATVSPSNATDKTVTWTSSDETVATVEDGVVTGVKAGTATITAKAGEESASCTVTVSDYPCLTFKGNEAYSLGILIVEESGFGKYWDGKVEYSTDKKTWTEWDGSAAITAVASNGSYYVYLRGKDNTTFASGVDLENNIFNGQTALAFTEADYNSDDEDDEETLEVECTGKITALLDYEAPDTAVMGAACFAYLFHDCTALTKAPELPSETLSSGCYYYMFDKCSALKTAPALPATTLANSCYECMFYLCTALTTAPELPAEELAPNCYGNMFYGCKSLVTPPALPATTLSNSCYSSMFSGCKALTTAPELKAQTLSYGCYMSMFYGCSALTAAPELPATTIADYCYASMFYGCSGLTESPSLPAETVCYQCYNQMFASCTSLTSVGKITATIIDQTSAMYRMFYKCSNLIVVQQDSADDYSFVTLTSVTDTATVIYAVNGMFLSCNSAGYRGSGTAGKSYKAVKAIKGTVSVAGENICGSTLAANYTPGATGETVTYQWYSSSDGSTWSAISGATSSTYVLTSSEKGKVVQVKATGYGYYTGTVASSATATVSGIAITGTVTITKEGETVSSGDILTATYTPGAAGETVTYQWYGSSDMGVNWEVISGETSETYTVGGYGFVKVIVTGSGNYAGTKESGSTDGILY